MFTGKNLEEKTYEQFIEEALLQIPLYDPQWTNFNKSDPGITILENFSAFSVLQQNYILQEKEEVKLALLKLAGFVPGGKSCARVLLEAHNVEEEFVIPENQQFMVGDLIFESDRTAMISEGKLTAVLVRMGEWMDCSRLLEKDSTFPVSIFSDKPQKGMELYFFMDGIAEDEKKLIFYLHTAGEYQRNPREGDVDFAFIRWQYYTKDGFMDLQAEDETDAFLFDGRITFQLGGAAPAIYQAGGKSGYVIRGILEKEEYDIPPQLIRVSGFLFEAVQRETKSILKTWENTRHISLYSDILEAEYFKIYRKEEGTEGFRLCGSSEYEIRHDGYGMYTFLFEEEQEQVMLTAYTEDMMHVCRLGMVYGYDEETISLPVKNVIAEGFSLLAELPDKKLGMRYYILFPETENPMGFWYTIEEEEGFIRIRESGNLTGAVLYLGAAAVSQGERGNLMEGKEFVPVGYRTDIHFSNPAPGEGGIHRESVQELESRFFQDVHQVYGAVTGRDFVKIIRETPALCIDKVGTYKKEGDETIYTVVKPAGPKRFPRLSARYKNLILRRLEERRLLNTNVKLENPVYIPVHVSGKIYVKDNYAGAGKAIEEAIRSQIDYLKSEKEFGEILKFDSVFESVERLKCVETIESFDIKPDSLLHAAMEGVDIRPAPNGLLYPGEIRIDVRSADFGTAGTGKWR